MSYNNGPKIITDGLIMCLDAGNSKSYPGTGGTWYDLSGYNNHATVYGSSVYSTDDGGKFDFGDVSQTSQYISLNTNAPQSTGVTWTMEYWMKPISSGGKYWCSMAASNADNNYFLMAQGADVLSKFSASGVSVSYSSGELLNFTIVRNGSDTGTFYKNGVTLGTSSLITVINGVATGGWILNQEQDTVGGGFDSGQNYRGAFMGVKLYNRALSSTEISQNYNAMKGRYGL